MPIKLFCRICWNTNHWRNPSGDAMHMECVGAYAKEHGFGHEEWLFNFDWEDEDGYKYAFLQPINKQYNKYKNTDCAITLYSKADDWYFVAKISDCHILSPDEKEYAFNLHRRKGWLREMKNHLKLLDCDTTTFEQEKENVFNIRFKKEDVTFLDPFILVPLNHRIRKFPRYQTFRGEYNFNDLKAKPAQTLGYSTQFKDTSRRRRKASPATEFEPRHDKIQNAFYCFLQNQYGHDAVFYENNHIDIVLRTGIETIYYEIKSDNTAKMNIRKALGQLMEYAYWNIKEEVHKLVIIGWCKPDAQAKDYLKRIRQQWGLNLYYCCFDERNKILSDYY